MRTSFLIDKFGVPISPAALPTFKPQNLQNPTFPTFISFEFYEAIINESGVIFPVSPVTSGVTGTITPSVLLSKDSAIEQLINPDGSPAYFDLSTDKIGEFTAPMYQLSLACQDVAGCNYIKVIVDYCA